MIRCTYYCVYRISFFPATHDGRDSKRMDEMKMRAAIFISETRVIYLETSRFPSSRVSRVSEFRPIHHRRPVFTWTTFQPVTILAFSRATSSTQTILISVINQPDAQLGQKKTSLPFIALRPCTPFEPGGVYHEPTSRFYFFLNFPRLCKKNHCVKKSGGWPENGGLLRAARSSKRNLRRPRTR